MFHSCPQYRMPAVLEPKLTMPPRARLDLPVHRLADCVQPHPAPGVRPPELSRERGASPAGSGERRRRALVTERAHSIRVPIGTARQRLLESHHRRLLPGATVLRACQTRGCPRTRRACLAARCTPFSEAPEVIATDVGAAEIKEGLMVGLEPVGQPLHLEQDARSSRRLQARQPNLRQR